MAIYDHLCISARSYGESVLIVCIILTPIHYVGLPEIKKNFYFEDPEVANMTEVEVEDFWYAWK